jgi:VCBS repeat-containing protein
MATLNVTGTNQVPAAPGGLSITVSENDAPFPFDLLTGATDPDTGDVLNVSGAMSTGDASGVVLAGNQLNVTPNSYNALAENVAEVVTYNYMLNDGHGGLTPQTAMVTITGVNDAPVAAGDLTAAVNEGETVVLSNTDLTASDPESAPTGLIYTLTALPANGGVNLSGVPLAMGGSFTQQNVNDGLVSYTHNSSETLSDSFMLTLADDDAMSPIVLPAMAFNITITLNDAPVVQLDTNPSPVLNYTGNFDLGTGTAVAISDVATIADTENDAIQQ